MPRGMLIYPMLCYAVMSVGIAMIVYMYICVGSALLVSTTWAMRRPRKVRRVTGTGSHAFLFKKRIYYHRIRGTYRRIEC